MKISSALILLILKASIKNFDKDYSTNDFLDDIFDAFGEEARNKIKNLLNNSHSNLEALLKEENLRGLGIQNDRIDIVKENVKDVLKKTKISREMLADYDFDAAKLIESIVQVKISEIGTEEEAVKRDLKIVLTEIVERDIQLIKEDPGFMSDILLEIKRYLERFDSKQTEIYKTVKETNEGVQELLAFKALFFELSKKVPDVWSGSQPSERINYSHHTMETVVEASIRSKGDL